MRVAVTEEQRYAIAYSMGKARQQCSLAMAIIAINILLALIMKAEGLGFNVAMFIIGIVSLYSNHKILRNLEEQFPIDESELIALSKNINLIWRK